ncbi:Bax inhibitor-1/YccA family protein [Mucilaginibacter myungsuensis]|uniref:Bax inhibitor-1/YccA family protein n=1 Tax=Mucilaginibacter myungsuensis TaxID=649104 RepID=A0A929KZW1_9SPHI|nr:Bax inhibitor-1/YccA family protein [Mucilaginibacter myungsuensis]MBE9661605.1 Bax inhibitor-1/YccA family protein [Mucilaginibacter myungsuensis]MDN3597750.1 Bax inhibitor-1/YccA family protein [Mucilaginibacter myungsuensis]
MEIKEKNYNYQSVFQMDDEVTSSRKFLAKVFSWMFVALAITSVLAYVFAHNPELQAYLRDPYTLKPTGLGTIAMFSPLAFVLIISFGFNRLSFPVLATIFIVYAAVFGISMSSIFLVYTGGSIFNVFLTATILFGVMAVAGYTTKTDLTNFGSILFVALIALVIASLINMFIKSETFDYILSLIGVAVFTGLTAYDVQKLKRIGAGIEQGNAPANKLAVMGALTLYLDFVNLFLFLLRLFGNRK